MKQFRLFLGISLFCFLTFSCQTKTQSGALGGAVGGAVVGGVAGGPYGALIGAGAGAVGGAIIGAVLDDADKERLDEDTRTKYNQKSGQISIDTIIALKEKGFSDEKIIGILEETKSTYPDITTSDIDRLRKAGVSDEVINYCLSTSSKR